MFHCDVLREAAVIDEATLAEISAQASEGPPDEILLASEVVIIVFSSQATSLDERYINGKAYIVYRA